MNHSALKRYVRRIEKTDNHEEKLILLLQGLIELFSFSAASLFAYSELTKDGRGVLRVNPEGLFSIRTWHENMPSIPPIYSAIQQRQVKYIRDVKSIQQIPAKYICGVSSLIVIPICFGSTVVGFMSTSQYTGADSIGESLLGSMNHYGELVGKILHTAHMQSGIRPLSRREIAVLQRMSWGESVKEMADNLNISPFTIQDYAKAAIRKLGAKNRTEAVAEALRKDIIK